jgi:heme-degrading monooxygenase HmoA
VSAPHVASLLLMRHRSIAANAAHLRHAGSALSAVVGVRFSQAMLTTSGPGGVVFPAFSPSRSAVFTVWEDEAALDEQVAAGTFRDWRESARELLLVRLRATRVKGTWDGRELLAPAPGDRDPGPVAVLTRVAVRYAIAPKMYAWALPRIARQLDRGPGVLLSIGMTNRPVRIGATFSMWRSLHEMQRFGYHDAPHGAVQRGARDHRWFDEELFVRFRVLSADGTWRGRTFSGPLG